MSDHISGPRALADPIADITDVYAFPSPERPGHLVLVQNTLPFAPATARFSDGLIYRFRLREVAVVDARAWAVAVRRSRRRGARVRLRVLRADGRRAAGGHVPHPERGHRRLRRGRRAGRLRARGAGLRRGALGSVHHGRSGGAEDDRHRAARVHRPRLDLHGRQERAEHRARDRLRQVPGRRRARRACVGDADARQGSTCASSGSAGRRSRTCCSRRSSSTRSTAISRSATSTTWRTASTSPTATSAPTGPG